MVYSQIKFRPQDGSPLERELIDRSENTEDPALSRVARRDLKRYYASIKASLPAFSEEEVNILLNALNGSRIERPERLYVEVLEYKEFAERLRCMSYIECIATVDAVERYWLGAYSKSPEENRARLKEVGLINGNGNGI